MRVSLWDCFICWLALVLLGTPGVRGDDASGDVPGPGDIPRRAAAMPTPQTMMPPASAAVPWPAATPQSQSPPSVGYGYVPATYAAAPAPVPMQVHHAGPLGRGIGNVGAWLERAPGSGERAPDAFRHDPGSATVRDVPALSAGRRGPAQAPSPALQPADPGEELRSVPLTLSRARGKEPQRYKEHFVSFVPLWFIF